MKRKSSKILMLLAVGILAALVALQSCATCDPRCTVQDQAGIKDAGCKAQVGNACPDWMFHDSVYYDWQHAKFSIYQHKTPGTYQIKKSAFRTWWGEPVKVIDLGGVKKTK